MVGGLAEHVVHGVVVGQADHGHLVGVERLGDGVRALGAQLDHGVDLGAAAVPHRDLGARLQEGPHHGLPHRAETDDRNRGGAALLRHVLILRVDTVAVGACGKWFIRAGRRDKTARAGTVAYVEVRIEVRRIQ